MASIRFVNLSKTWGANKPVLQGINLDIVDGEFLVLVGPSGCGKSTLLRMLAGLESISEGELYIGDKLANHIPPAQRGLAMVFQSYALYPHMNVFDNMAFALKMAGKAKAEIKQEVERAAEILQITPLLARKPGQLSGGQRQRVAIGRAIVRQPQVFLFDEPLSNLDASLRLQMRLELAKLHQNLKSTMVYVTHDQVEAMTLGQRIVVLQGGKIEQVGTPQQLYEQPSNVFVAGFLGTPKMNFLPARALGEHSGDGAGWQLSCGSAQLTIPPAHWATGAARERDWQGQALTLGIRAEHLEILATASGAKDELPAQVAHIEYLGDSAQVYLHCTLSEDLLCARQAVNSLSACQAGQNVWLKVATQHCHVFDQDGVALSHGKSC